MSDERRRRRRAPSNGGPRRSNDANGIAPWLITIAAALAVIAGGWFLGQALAHAFGSRNESQTAQAGPTSIPIVTPLPSPSAPAATPAPSPTESPTSVPRSIAAATPAASPSEAPAETPTAAPTQAPTPSPAPTATPVASPVPTEHERTPAPSAVPSREPSTAPAPVAQAPQAPSAAEQTVRAYIGALMRGDPQAASSYLGNGAPDESFINAQTRIQSMAETVNADGSANVDVVMQTSAGEYRETFEVASASSGSRILGRSASKP